MKAGFMICITVCYTRSINWYIKLINLTINKLININS